MDVSRGFRLGGRTVDELARIGQPLQSRCKGANSVLDRGSGVEHPIISSGEDHRIAESLRDPEDLVARILHPERRGELYAYYHRLRSIAPVHRTEAPGLPAGTTFITSARAVDQIARSGDAVNDPRTAQVWDYEGTGEGSFYRMMSRAMLFLEKSAHDRVRRIVYKAFTPTSVAPLGDLAKQVASELLDAATERGATMDFVESFAYPLPLRAIMRLLGIPKEAETTIERWAWDFARAGDPMTATSEIIDRGNTAARGFYDFFSRLLKERESRLQDDLISALLQAEEEGGKLTRDEAISTLVLLLQAGHDTTSDLLGNAMIGLFRHPLVLESLITEPARMKAATEEFLRYDTSVQISMRLARERIDLDGEVIQKGSLIALAYGAANRDPEYYDEPDRLDLDRRPTHWAFSAGAYYCLGNALARTEIRSALEILFERLPQIRPGQEHFTQRATTRLRGPLSLLVRWD